MLIFVKLLMSAGLIYLVNEIVVAHSRPFLGSLVASLPLVSLLTFFWIWFDLTGQPERRAEVLASHSLGVFWFVLPSLPMFPLLAWLLRRGVSFWPALLLCGILTMSLYALMAAILKRWGVNL